ncbi:acyl-CoA dehydrogenase family protein [Acidiferrimicrobium sp. IK]|uniref:acyl-CoA dehydrogenase family protein n=1 Tax=Acidiferrimicrobium sp. IK TaxID=2871700 RepID=UPI0021CB999C|nr:acyl-CoA dehydrogenase family protein [Acidiferrimicrobium sp. IK]MCU4183969.1 acyl-CoA dehydrogenase family protein [Acidiferrimicrobium sp. IK]
MDLDAFRRSARQWLASEATDAPPDYGAIVPEQWADAGRRWQRHVHDSGFAGIHWPVRFGGRGLSPAHTSVWVEECARAGVPPYLNMVGLVLTAEALLAFGTERQQSAHLPALASGAALWCQMFSEPDAGSDLAHLRTVAIRDGEGWRLEGQKVWTSNAHFADWAICLARTDLEAPAHRGLSLFLLDVHSPGVTVLPLRQMTGQREFAQVVLDGVAVPSEALLGDVNGGWRVTMSTLGHERDHVGGLVISMNHQIAETVRYLDEATPVAKDRAVRLWTRGRALGHLGQQRARLGDAGASLMKLGVTGLGLEHADLTAALAGPAATVSGPAASRVGAAPALGIAGGTTEVQKSIIAERLLGLPR